VAASDSTSSVNEAFFDERDLMKAKEKKRSNSGGGSVQKQARKKKSTPMKYEDLLLEAA